MINGSRLAHAVDYRPFSPPMLPFQTAWTVWLVRRQWLGCHCRCRNGAKRRRGLALRRQREKEEAPSEQRPGRGGGPYNVPSLRLDAAQRRRSSARRRPHCAHTPVSGQAAGSHPGTLWPVPGLNCHAGSAAARRPESRKRQGDGLFWRAGRFTSDCRRDLQGTRVGCSTAGTI